MKQINVGIIGASGYTGLELVKILLTHPNFNINYVATSSGETFITKLHPSLDAVFECEVVKADSLDVAKKCDLVFLALPHKTAMVFVKELINLNVKVVDLSADYRLDQKRYEIYYTKHIDVKNIENSVYGLPELFSDDIKSTSLVANPGCYPTASILGLLAFRKYIKKDTKIIIDAKSGVSGAGKKLSEATHFVSINDNMHAYNPLEHRHSPEIAKYIEVDDDKVIFVPHLVPATRGMLSSIYIEVDENFDEKEVLKEFYKNNYFVRVRDEPVCMKNVAGTNFCDIYVKRAGNTLFISSAIDNLLRGASSQAVVNANLMYGLDEKVGIPIISYVP